MLLAHMSAIADHVVALLVVGLAEHLYRRWR
jgi:hypothetical protein